jgi:deazaflavin-dependent oxidoreductase (nitroreductase family)
MLAVGAGEFLGFCAPALAGALIAVNGVPTLPVLVLAGCLEGMVLGYSQAWVLRQRFPALSTRRWVAATSVAAALAWLLGMLPSTLQETWSNWPGPAVAIAGLVVGGTLLSCMGVAQWTQLRRHVPRARPWIIGTTLAWSLGLLAFFAVTSPLWQPGQPPVVVAAVGVLGGLCMAIVMAAVTGLTLVHILDHGTTHPPIADIKRVFVNPLVEALLRSRWHRVLSRSTVLLTYRGARTGDTHTVALAYAQHGADLVVAAGHYRHKCWWRNFRQATGVQLLLRGEQYRATARRVLVFDKDYEKALNLYRRCHPHAGVDLGVPLVHLRLAGTAAPPAGKDI